jgi:hypothetical protein
MRVDLVGAGRRGVLYAPTSHDSPEVTALVVAAPGESLPTDVHLSLVYPREVAP